MFVAGNHTTAVTTAIGEGSVGLSFGGAGFLIFYYIGIVDVLTRLGVLTASAKVAGVSSGALIATSQCSGMTPQQMLTSSLALATACRENHSCMGTLDKNLKRVLKTYVPTGSWEKCVNTGYLAMTNGTPAGRSDPMLIADFTSADDLINATAVCAYLPLVSNGGIYTHFRGSAAYDAGWTLPQPCPPDVTYCIKISTRNPTWPRNRRSIPAFVGGFIGQLWQAYFSKPSSSSSSSSRTTVQARPPLKIISTGPDGRPDLGHVRIAAENNMDIAPGIFNHVPFTQQQWNDWSWKPTDQDTIMDIYELGKADALSWAKFVGVSAKKIQENVQMVATE